VVVVEHHQRVGVVGDRGQHRFGDVAVDGRVAAVPCVELFLADVRSVREVPEVVLDKPEDRVRDHVVEAVVGLALGLDQEDVVADVVELDAGRLPLRLARHGEVLVRHRRRDPERPAVGHQPAQGGDETAAAAPRDALTGLRAVELSRPPVGDDYEGSVVLSHLPQRTQGQIG
jgi:hypothetical protein